MANARVWNAWLLVLLAVAATPAALAQRGAAPRLGRVVCQVEPAALYAGAGANAPLAGVVLYQTGVTRMEDRGERARVELPSLGVRGALWISRDAVGAYALEGARVRGTSVSVRRGDVVCVRQEDAGQGRAQVLVRTRVGAGVRFDASAGLVEARDRTQLWSGTYPRSGLSAEEPTPADPLASLPPMRFAVPSDGQPVEVFAAPDGPRILTVDAQVVAAVTRVRQDGPWSALRIGDGPFVLGFTRAALVGLSERDNARAQQVAAMVSQLGASPNARFANARSGGPSHVDVPAVLSDGDSAHPIRALPAGATLRTVSGDTLRASARVFVRVEAVRADGQVRVLAALTRTAALYADVNATDLVEVPR